MKKIFLISLVFLLFGCTEENIAELSALVEDINIEAEEGVLSISDDETSFEVTLDTDTGIGIPSWYLQEVIPIYEPSVILTATHADDGVMMVLGNSKDDLTTVKEFYDTYLEDAKSSMKNTFDDSYLNLGYINGYSYNVTVTTADEPYGSGFMITIVPDDPPATSDADPVINTIDYGDMVLLPEHSEWPADYPEDVLPHYVEAVSDVRLISHSEGQTLIAFASEGSFEDVYQYYYDLLKTGTNFITYDQDDTQIIISSKGGYNLNVIIADNSGELDPNPQYKSLVEIIYIKE